MNNRKNIFNAWFYRRFFSTFFSPPSLQKSLFGKIEGFSKRHYITNTELTADRVYEQYSGLWQIERVFRITKGTLELRPMFHFTKKRIEAHVCICFVVYKVYKELEWILRLKRISLSVDKVLDIAKTITTLKIKLPISNEIMTKTMLITKKHQSIAELYNENFWKNL